MINDSTQRIPPQGDNRENEVGGLLAAASDFARSVLESIQALAGTTTCKGVQLVKLKKLKTKVPMTTGFRKFFFEKAW